MSVFLDKGTVLSTGVIIITFQSNLVLVNGFYNLR